MKKQKEKEDEWKRGNERKWRREERGNYIGKVRTQIQSNIYVHACIHHESVHRLQIVVCVP